MRIVVVVALGVSVHVDIAAIVQLRFRLVLAEELILDGKGRVDGVGGLATPSQICDGNRVAILDHVTQVVGRHATSVG